MIGVWYISSVDVLNIRIVVKLATALEGASNAPSQRVGNQHFHRNLVTFQPSLPSPRSSLSPRLLDLWWVIFLLEVSFCRLK